MIATDFMRAVKTLAWREFVLYPKSNLIDYYKLFYQGTFGPGHLISNRQTAYSHLLEEIVDSSNTEAPFLQDISFINPYCRVSLEIVEKKLIEADAFFDILLESCTVQRILSPIEWNEAWLDIENILFQILPKLKEQDLADTIHNHLHGDKVPIFRHSESFREAYHPHYRLIRKDLLPSHILLYT